MVTGAVLAIIFGFVFFFLSVYGLNGAITYKTGHVRAAVAGYWIKAVLMIIGLIAIVSIVDKNGRYESNGETYELVIDMTALIIIGVICK